MYRIELTPGEETALRTPEELATGVRNGVITSRARIWHNAGRKWLPIELHPHYQEALRQIGAARGEQAAPDAAPDVAPAPASGLAVDPTAGPPPAPPTSAPATRPLGLLAGGIVMIAGAQMVASATSSAATAATPAAVVTQPSASPRFLPADAASTAAATAPPRSETLTIPDPNPNGDPLEGGGVVRGPVASVPAPAPAEPPAADTLPEIPPAPPLGEMPLPSLPVDNP